MGLFGRWLRADNPDYHPGINKQLLLEAERAECSTEIRSLIRMARGSSGDVHSTPQCEKTKDNSGQRKVQLPLDMWNALVNEKERERVHLENTMPANDDPSSRDPANTAIGYDVDRGGFGSGGSGIGQIRCPSVENKFTDNPSANRPLISSGGRVG
jgi:hypothetical protein